MMAEFTETDRKILRALIPVVDGMADYLGSGYEIVLHSLEDLEHSVIHIVNGEHTGRKVGAPITDLALERLNKIRQEKNTGITYFTRNKKGEGMKSTTIIIYGERKKAIGLLCMNLYLNTPFQEMLQSFLPEKENAVMTLPQENFAENSEDLIRSMYETARETVLADAGISPSLRNKEIIAILYEKGIFNIKDAVVKVARLMEISKNTVYMHVRNIKNR